MNKIRLKIGRDELEVIIENSLRKVFAENQINFPIRTTQAEHKTLHSIQALADFLGCSTVTAQKLKNSGKIPFQQYNRKVIFDSVEVLEALSQNKPKKK